MTSGALLNYQDVTFQSQQGGLASLGDELAAVLPASRWARETDKEEQWPQKGTSGVGFVFARQADKLPAASVFVLVNEREGSVSNIVPKEMGKLSFDQYNSILADFVDQGLKVVAPKLNLVLTVTKANRPITDWISEAAAKKLQSFSNLANKSTGASHPSDNARWLGFIIQAFREKATLDAGTLRRWLIEVERWPEEQADDLAAQYDFSRDLLDHYTKS
jgi:hypothetical protein